MPGRVRPRMVVPSDNTPTLELAISASPNGAAIQLLAGHCEHLDILILDQPFEIEGPADQSATLVVENGIICALHQRPSDLVLRNLTLHSADATVLTVIGPCSIEFCNISSAGSGIGLQVTGGHLKDLPYIAQNKICKCRSALHLDGSCHAVLDRNRLEDNLVGVTVVGLQLPEGPSEGLQALERTQFLRNTRADVELVSLSICDAFDGSLHTVDATVELCLPVFRQARTLAARTEQCALALRIDRGFTFAALSAPGPFESSVVGMLPRHGRWCTSPLPSGTGIRERRRDFARLVAPDGPDSFVVVAPGESPPMHWARRRNGELASCDVSSSAGDAAAADLATWLADALQTASRPMQSSLADNCIALLSAGEGVSFAMTYGLTPVLSQPHFALLASPLGDVRIAWFVYVTDDIRPSTLTKNWLAVLLTEDLNSLDLSQRSTGVWLQFAVSATDEREMSQILARNTATLRRAVDQGDWELVLAAV